jgi:methyl-accepting chemotaxis protein
MVEKVGVLFYEQGLSKVRKSADQFAKSIKVLRTAEVKPLGRNFEEVTIRTQKWTGRLKQLDGTMKQVRRSTKKFKFEFLGLLFFGFVIQRTFLNIQRAAIDTFKKIAEGSALANKTIGVLSAQFTFLRFAVGEALARALLPLIPTIASLIEKVVDFISQHSGLVAAFILIGIVAGTLFTTIGQLALGFSSLSLAIFGANGAKAALAGMTAGAIKFAIVAAVLVALAWLAYKAFKAHPEVFAEVKESINLFMETVQQFIGTLFKLNTTVDDTKDKIDALGVVAVVFGTVFNSIIAILTLGWSALLGTIQLLRLLGQTFLDVINLFKTGEADFSKTSGELEIMQGIGGRVVDAFKNIAGPVRALNSSVNEQAEGVSLLTDKQTQLGNDALPLVSDASAILAETTNMTSDAFANQQFQVEGLTTSVNNLAAAYQNAVNQANNISSNIGTGGAGGGPGRQFGGIIPTSGMFRLHAGEVITRPPFNPNITTTINTGPISHGLDVNMVARKVNDVIMDGIKRHVTPVTKYGA